ncbi:MAG: hypothetical protein JST68_00050, partial [Bacteroidetes bacterium]|nr:hypothetical protein [Bacteroidota bacterium]
MQPIIQHLFQTSNLGEVSRERLDSFVQEYPSFGIGHYLLSRKLREEGADNYGEETQKTSLYFSNPFWLQWLLESGEEMSHSQPVTTARTITPSPAESVEEAIESTPPTTEIAQSQPVEEEPVGTSIVSLAEEALASEAPETKTGSVVTLAEAAAADNEPTAAELLLQSIQEAKGLRDSLHQINEDFNIGKPALPEESTPFEEPIKDEEPPFVLDEAPAAEEPPADAPAPAIEPEPEVAPEPVIATAPAAEPSLVFEPYHTIDYFASQGIK